MPGHDSLKEIRDLLTGDPRPIVLMEVCGTHTMAIARAGIKRLLPPGIRLISGPGCPVCVTPTEVIDYACRLAQDGKNIIVSFGDMVRVPGSSGRLENYRYRLAYSPRDALAVARDNPGQNVIFVGVGFETTAPAVAATVIEARALKLNNFFVLPALKTVPPALVHMVRRGRIRIDGFILPGHVSAIIGERPYQFVARRYGIPGCITGFEPAEILRGILNLIRQIRGGKPRIANEYRWVVKPGGNPAARRLMNRVFRTVPSRWRGIGLIPASGLAFRDAYLAFDARCRFKLKIPRAADPPGCLCAQVLLGLKEPADCELFGRRCTPDEPVGACMVSSEGSCAAAYKYGTDRA